MKERKLPFMGGTIIAAVVILVLAIVYKVGYNEPAEDRIINVEPTERPTLGFLEDTQFINLPTE